MKQLKSQLCVFAVIFTLLSISTAQAASVTIINAGFEDFVLSDGTFSRPYGGTAGSVVSADPIPGWTLSNPNGDGGTFNPTTGQYATGAPEGENVAYSSTQTLPPTISQVLSSNLTANTKYTLKIEVGQRLDNARDFGGYLIQLLAGGVVLAEDDNSLTPNKGEFLTSTVMFLAETGHAQLGTALEIRFKAINAQVNFDDVRLDATTVPVPAAVWLFGSSLLGLISISRRKIDTK